MKIGILTQPLHANYGGLLQNYALQQTLIRAGHEAETIDWWVPNSLYASLYRIKECILASLYPRKHIRPKYQPTEKENAIIRKNTNHFIHAHIHHTNPMMSMSAFEQQAKIGNYDSFVVGSDQCWRPRFNPFLPAMFLSFTVDKTVKRIAYAASFGTDRWEYSSDLTSQCAFLAQKFDLVSVREDSGVRLCKEHLRVDAIHVLDPTMLLTKDDYIRLIEEEGEPQSAGSLFNYILDPDATKIAFINQVARELDLKPFQVLPKYQAETRSKKDIKKRIEDCVFPRVTTWLRAFMDAEMIIVDSFHGMVFSILFNKPFWVFGNAERGMSRFSSLLKILGLEDRLLDVRELDNVEYARPIDWGRVNAILNQKRIESRNLLINSLK